MATATFPPSPVVHSQTIPEIPIRQNKNENRQPTTTSSLSKTLAELSSQDEEVVKKASIETAKASLHLDNHATIATITDDLVRLIEHKKGLTLRCAIVTLANLCLSEQHKGEVFASGAIPALFGGIGRDQRVTEDALLVLLRLSHGMEDRRVSFTNPHVIALVSFLTSKSLTVAKRAAGTLRNIGYGPRAHERRLRIAHQPNFGNSALSLMRKAKQQSSRDASTLEEVLSLLANITHGRGASPEQLVEVGAVCESLMGSGVIPEVLSVFNGGWSPRCTARAAAVLRNLTGGSEVCGAGLVGKGGFVSLLSVLHLTDDPRLRIEVAATISNLASRASLASILHESISSLTDALSFHGPGQKHVLLSVYHLTSHRSVHDQVQGNNKLIVALSGVECQESSSVEMKRIARLALRQVVIQPPGDHNQERATALEDFALS